MGKIPPLITTDSIDDSMAISILENSIFNMSMSDELNNSTLCLLTAMRRGVDALKREQTREAIKEYTKDEP